jgi:ketosteroid isomerase-like protein
MKFCGKCATPLNPRCPQCGFGNPPFLNALADHVEWQVPGPIDILPWAGTCRGREQATQFFAEFAKTAENEQFEPQEFIAQGDKVVVLGHSH